MDTPKWPAEKPVVATPPGSIDSRTSFAIYLGGVAILLVGLVFGAILLGMPGPWIAVCALVLSGLAVVGGIPQRLVFRPRRKPG